MRTFLIILILPLTLQSQSWTLSLDSVSLFSSPVVTDLNQDSILDIVIGGGVEGLPISAGITAINGANGQILWQRPARDQIFGTALLHDINNDQVADVFIGGRNALFLGIDGATGDLIWEFWADSLPNPAAFGHYQFYNAQWTPDLNQDGLPDLLMSNGGDATAAPYDSLRPPGRLMLLSALDGSLIAEAEVPDSHETYFSPLLLDNDGLGDPWIIFGTGGETVRGRLWAARLSELRNGDLSSALLLLDDPEKGFIASPSLADLNNDQVPDLIVPQLNEKLIALDGATFTSLWSLDFPGYEMYTAPCIGQFTGDARPDLYCVAARGLWSFYGDYLQFVVDGGTGQIVWSDTATHYQFSQGNAVDRDGDGWDEILVMQNRDIGFSTIEYRNQLRWIDVNDNQIQDFGLQRNGLSVFTTPVLADLDGDQSLEIVFGYHPPRGMWAGITGAQIERVDLNLNVSYVAWPGFMGRNRDALYIPPPGSVGSNPIVLAENVQVFPNPVKETLHIVGTRPSELLLRDMNGQLLKVGGNTDRMEMGDLPAGMYVLELRFRNRTDRVKVVRN